MELAHRQAGWSILLYFDVQGTTCTSARIAWGYCFGIHTVQEMAVDQCLSFWQEWLGEVATWELQFHPTQHCFKCMHDNLIPASNCHKLVLNHWIDSVISRHVYIRSRWSGWMHSNPAWGLVGEARDVVLDSWVRYYITKGDIFMRSATNTSGIGSWWVYQIEWKKEGVGRGCEVGMTLQGEE